MSIVGFVPDPDSAALVVAWVRALAEDDEETEFLCFETGFDGRTVEAVRAALGREGEGGPALKPIDDPMPVTAVVEEVRRRRARLLVTAPFEMPAVSGRPQTSDALLPAAPCQTFALEFGSKTPAQVEKVLVVATTGAHNRAVLRLAEALRQRHGARVTVGIVEDETGALAGQAGEGAVQALLHDMTLDQAGYEVRVVVDRLKHRGIIALHEDHDLVVTGLDAASHVRPLEQSLGDATLAIVKRTPPLRLRAIADRMPRINPADHAALLNSLQLGSRWAPDFFGMLGLAAAIASLGLLQNSPAVVIGSMLLAPLMTPMIGLGLAMAQANRGLARQCRKSIGLGFLLTLTVSFLIGVVTPSGATLSGEVLARGGPNVLDLLIAVFAAAAATFAMARPGISGAIAGVAIATALVPPVCSVGISLSQGAWLNALGATVLFLTNLVAIMVVSCFTFIFLGVTAARVLPRVRRRARITRAALVLLLIGLAGPLSTALVAQLEEGKNVPLAHPVTTAVFDALHERVDQDEGVEIMFMARPRAEHRVMVHITSRDELPMRYADELRAIVRAQMDDPELTVNVVAVRGLWRSDEDSPRDASR